VLFVGIDASFLLNYLALFVYCPQNKLINMAWGISPYISEVVPLEDYNSDFYLTLIYHATENLGWHIGYFDHDGIIAYTNLSWPSYSEEISVRIKNNTAIVKSECVGVQGFFTDYGKNKKNIDLLFSEIDYVNYHLQDTLEKNTQELMDAVPEKQFLSLDNPPMSGKETLRSFFSAFVPKKDYFITPLLVLSNLLLYIISVVAMASLFMAAYAKGHLDEDFTSIRENVYLFLGYSERGLVLNGQIWRLATSTFLHFSVIHVASNMIALIYIGSMIESKLGRLNYLLLYLFTGIIASMVSVMWRDHGISGGASGAIFGLYGILLALSSTDFYERSARRALFISTAFFIGLNIIPIGEGIDHAAHFGGLVSGYIFGLISYATLHSKNQLIKKWGSPIAAFIIMAVFVSSGLILTPNYQLKKYASLIDKTEDFSGKMNDYFYGQDSLNRQQRLDTLEQKALPEIKVGGDISAALRTLVLPAKKKKIAVIRSEIITLECRFYKLLYLEFKEQNKTKYRPEINSITDNINTLREKGGNIESN
jgi:rhomboid protease GluP